MAFVRSYIYDVPYPITLSTLGAIRAILNAAQSLLEVEAAGRWKIVTLIGGVEENEGERTAQVLP